tara:strand:- start:317 stop:517 length:201 start_codon:yes stop_codon:yes gene_type:complete
MKVGDLVSFDVYQPSSSIFMTTHKGLIIKEIPPNPYRQEPLFNVFSTSGVLFEYIARTSIRVLRPA